MLPWGQRAYHIGLVPVGSTWCGVEPMLHKRQWVTGSEMQVLPSRFMLKFLGGLKLKGELSCQSENLGIWGGMEGSESSRILATDWRVWTLLGSPGGLPQYPAWDSFSARIYSGSLGWKLTLWVLLPTAKKILCAGERGLIPCANGVLWTLVFPVGALISLLPWGAGGLHSSFFSAQLASSPTFHLSRWRASCGSAPEDLLGLVWLAELELRAL